jgi:hypothetical protein
MPWDLAAAANRAVRQTFGETATVAGTSCRAVFDQAHQLVELSGDVPVTTTRPVLDVVLADLPAVPTIGAAVIVDGTTYEIRDVQPDGQGMAKLTLFAA